MKTWFKRLTVVALATVMILTALGTAAAQGPSGGPEAEPPTPQPGGGRVLGMLLERLHEATGITLEDLQARREARMTLAEIFRENDMDPEAIAEEVKAALTAEIDQALAEGRITQEQADKLKAGLDGAIERALNSPQALNAALRGLRERANQTRQRAEERLNNSLVGTVAEMSNTDPRDIVREWRESGSLAAVIEAHGLSVDEVVTATEAKIAEKINEAVSAGRLSEEQAARALEGLHDRLLERVNNAPLAVFPALRERAAELVDLTLVGVIADMAGTDVRGLFTPPTLAEIAAQNGVDVEAAVQEAETRITERVNQWVAEGKLTEEQAAQILEGLHDRLMERMEQPIGQNLRPSGERFGGFGAQPPAQEGAPTN